MPAEAATVEAVHDFTAKLLQPEVRPMLLAYLDWRRKVRHAFAAGTAPPPAPSFGPLSINLDLTTACNYACDHCIDWDALNSPVRHDDGRLRDSLRELSRRGLRSVILIGGGEPTLHPGFSSMVAFLKGLGLQVAVVSNGSRNDRILEAAPHFTAGDWVRLSLDSGRDATFQAMHRPRGRGTTLEAICGSIARIKACNPDLVIGFSFVIVWKGTSRDGTPLLDNVGEISAAAELARDSGFDYISFKPCLMRTGEGAEVVAASGGEEDGASLSDRIRAGLDAAEALETGSFRVLRSLNLKVFLEGRGNDFAHQPRECHMQALRQVLSPLGTFNCPAHRGVAKARLGGAAAWEEEGREGRAGTARLLDTFHADEECREVTCLYNPVNWFLEGMIESGDDLEDALGIHPALGDFFL